MICQRWKIDKVYQAASMEGIKDLIRKKHVLDKAQLVNAMNWTINIDIKWFATSSCVSSDDEMVIQLSSGKTETKEEWSDQGLLKMSMYMYMANNKTLHSIFDMICKGKGIYPCIKKQYPQEMDSWLYVIIMCISLVKIMST